MIYNSFPYFFPYYIKKEDAKNFTLIYRKTIGIVFLTCFGVVAIMQIVISPKLILLYKDVTQPLPLMTQYSNQISLILGIIFLVISIYIIITPPNYKEIDEKLMKYKTGEMIKVNELINIKYITLIMVLLGLLVGFLVLVNIVPIYSLTSSL